MNPEPKRKLLLVEDEPVVAVTTSAMLKRNGYDVVSVSSGPRAIEAVSADSSIDLILMDIDLGTGMSGPDAAREILKTRDIPIVFLTSHSEREMVYKVRAITRYGYVIKNSGDFVLLSSIEMAFELFESHMKLKTTSEQLAESEKSIRRKLDSILMPEAEVESLALEDLVDAAMLQSISDDFYKISGMPIGIFNIAGDCLVATGWQDICTKFHRVNPESRKSCIESDTILTRGVGKGELREYKCKNNMRDIVTPIMHGDKHIGNIFLGQFLYDDETPDIEVFREQAKKYGYDEESYLEALERVPRWSREKVHTLLSYYLKIADVISQLTYNNIRLAKAVAERDNLNEQLSEKSGLLEMITDNMIDLVFMMDASRCFKYISPSFEKILGYSNADLLGRNIMEKVHPDDMERINSEIDNMLNKGYATVDYRYRSKNGEYLWYESRGKVLRDNRGDITGAVVGSRDITERKLAEEKIHENEEKFSTAFYFSPLMMAISDIDTGRYREINDSFCSILEFSRDELLGRTSIELGILSSNDRAQIKAELERNGRIAGRIIQINKKNGESLFCSFNGEIVTIGGEKKFLTIAENITERIEAERKLKESEEIFSKAFQNGPLIMTLSEFDTGRYIEVNRNFTKYTGFTRDEAVGRTSIEIGLIRAEERDRLIRAVETSGIVAGLEMALYRKNGMEIKALYFGDAITIAGRKMLLSMVQDITDQKTAIKKFEQSEARYKMLIERSPLFIFLVRNGRYIFANPAGVKRLGFSSSEEVNGRSVEDFLMPESLDIIKGRIANTENGIENQPIELTMTTPAGEVYTTESLSLPVTLDDGPAIMIISRDLTKEKQMQRELAEKEKFFSTYIESSPLGIYITDLSGDCIYANKGWLKMAGLTVEQAGGRGWIDALHPDDRLTIRDKWDESVKSSGKWGFEYRFKDRDGMVTWVYSTMSPVFNSENILTGYLSFNIDITDQVIARELIRDGEEKFRTIADNTYDWEFWVGIDGRMRYTSPSCEEISGYSASEFMDNPELLSSIIFEEDRNSPCLHPYCVAATPEKNETEFRIRTKHGETKWIAHACRAVYDSEGRFAGRRGSNRDVTSRHEMEVELYKTYDRVESLWNISRLFDVDFKTICDHILEAITRITDSPYGFYGFINENETVMTIHTWSGLAMADCSMVDKPAEFLLSDCGLWAEAVRNKRDLLINDYSEDHPAKKGYPAGHVELKRLMAIPLIKEGKVIAVAAVANKAGDYNEHDALLVRTFIGNSQAIVDRKRAEDSVRESERKLKVMMNATTDGAFLIDRNGTILEANITLAERFGMSVEELTGKDIYSILPEENARYRRAIIGGVITTGTPAHFTDQRGDIILENNVYPVFNSTGEVSSIAVFSRDVTDRKKADDEIKTLLEQKEMLLREVHHRIKNNMNTIAGLLKLQSLSMTDTSAVEALNDARGRVQNMMLIYDKLYRSADYKNLQVRDYFDNLLNEIVKIFPNHGMVSVIKRIDDFRLDSKILFTMGIMINELITNAFKYAFDGVEMPELIFSLKMDKGRIIFSVRDNGKGLPENIKNGERDGFGLNLVSSLAEQLEGEMRIGEGPGTEIIVAFSL